MMWDGYKLSERAALAAMGIRPQPQTEMTISPSALARARSKPSEAPSPMAMDAASIFTPPTFPEGTYPDATMASDYMPPFGGAVSSWATQSVFHEGQGFFGYPYLAELMQRAEYRHAAEIWAEHAVRKWIKFTGGTPETREKIEKEFDRLHVRDVVHRWLINDQGFGRGQMFLDFGDADDPTEIRLPLLLSDKKIGPNGKRLQSLNIVEPMWSAPGIYSTNNPLRADFYKPEYWLVYGNTVHASRLLTITSKPVSDMLKPAYAFGGQSLTQIMKPYVDNWLRTRQAVSDMLNSYSVLVFKTDMSSVMGGGNGSSVFDRLDIFNALRDNRGSFAIDMNQEDLVNVAVPLSGLSDLQAQSQEQMASAARIPLSIYLQITPTGLNATSDGETRNFYADVHGYQEKNMLRPLFVILACVQLSLFGKIDTSIGIQFEPLWEMSDADKALIRKSDADAHAQYVAMGAVSNEEVREALENEEDGLYHGVDLSGPAPEPEEEDDANDNSSGNSGSGSDR